MAARRKIFAPHCVSANWRPKSERRLRDQHLRAVAPAGGDDAVGVTELRDEPAQLFRGRRAVGVDEGEHVSRGHLETKPDRAALAEPGGQVEKAQVGIRGDHVGDDAGGPVAACVGYDDDLFGGKFCPQSAQHRADAPLFIMGGYHDAQHV
jgi:hypothetical protein